MSNAYYLDKFKNIMDMVSSFEVKLYDQDSVDIVTEEKYLGGRYEILYSDKKETVQQSDK